MRKIFPTSDTSKLDLLSRLAGEAQQPQRSISLFDAALTDTLVQTAADYQQESHALMAVRSQIKLVRDQRREQLVYLKHLLRRAFGVVRARAKEPGFLTAHVTFLGLLQDARQPKLIRDLSQPVQIAKDLLFANRALDAEGVRVLIDPSPEQIQVVIDAVEADDRRLNDLLDQERAALEAIRQRRKSVCRVLRRVSIVIEMATLDWPAETRRNLMRSLGFQFRSESKEAREEEVETQAEADVETQSEVGVETEASPADPASATTEEIHDEPADVGTSMPNTPISPYCSAEQSGHGNGRLQGTDCPNSNPYLARSMLRT